MPPSVPNVDSGRGPRRVPAVLELAPETERRSRWSSGSPTLECMLGRRLGRVVLDRGRRRDRERLRTAQRRVDGDGRALKRARGVDEDDRPIAHEPFRVIVPDGSPRTGTLNERGFARIDGIDPGTCDVTVPDIDAREWRRQSIGFAGLTRFREDRNLPRRVVRSTEFFQTRRIPFRWRAGLPDPRRSTDRREDAR